MCSKSSVINACMYECIHALVYFIVTSGRESNVNIPGVWLFKIGNMYGSNIESPQMSGGRRALAADLVLLLKYKRSQFYIQSWYYLTYLSEYTSHKTIIVSSQGHHLAWPPAPRQASAPVTRRRSVVTTTAASVASALATRTAMASTASKPV